jgi:hypothetical protein
MMMSRVFSNQVSARIFKWKPQGKTKAIGVAARLPSKLTSFPTVFSSEIPTTTVNAQIIHHERLINQNFNLESSFIPLNK